MTEKLELKNSELSRLYDEMEQQKKFTEREIKKREELLKELKYEKEQLEAEKAEQSRIEAEVGTIFNSHAIDQESEHKWKERVDDLENALQVSEQSGSILV